MERRRNFDGRRKPREKVYLDRIAVRERLDAVGLTPEEASERMGYSPKYLDRVLRGGKAVSKRARQALQRVLGRDVSATDVKATLPEGVARRGFQPKEILGLQFQKHHDQARADRQHKLVPGFVGRTQLPEALQDYFRAGYAGLNERLRHGQPLAESQQQILRELLAQTKPLQVGVPLYRGVILHNLRDQAIARLHSPGFKHEFARGQTLIQLSPLSTSTHLHVPLRFANALGAGFSPAHTGSVVFELHGSEGKPAVVTNSGEQEVLLAPGGKLRVLHVEPRVHVPGRRALGGGELSDALVDEWVVAEVR